ncbi:hypothetical protein Moror_484 [Moniliophthora roreri MCA 2997]|uniref:Uncharacterized protein n=1 Tax=Moniliophthora roreri (strain MCA 2997) TaxID=1381753 RepID=V2XFR8_MONRO|nr:hypothetical protein Moror_484 [Moniliophthora roreri MCA 2997]
MSGRQSTVYDLTSLRLHADSARVQQSERNRKLRFSRLTVRDSRGNWIARDAGGLGRVTRYRTLHGREQEREQSVGVSTSDDEAFGGKGKERMSDSDGDEERGLRTKRARKKRKFDNDFGYIAPSSTYERFSSTPIPQTSTPECLLSSGPSLLPPPSSDLLKCIHYMTSKYYHERGQLLNSSKDYRKERKERRLAKLRRRYPRPLSKGAPDDREDGVDEVNEDDPEFSSSDESNGSDGTTKLQREHREEAGIRGKRRRGVERQRNIMVDMYKTMNGSALMALGMLIQEHVAEFLRPQIPEDWEAELHESGEEGKVGKTVLEDEEVVENLIVGEDDTNHGNNAS